MWHSVYRVASPSTRVDSAKPAVPPLVSLPSSLPFRFLFLPPLPLPPFCRKAAPYSNGSGGAVRSTSVSGSPVNFDVLNNLRIGWGLNIFIYLCCHLKSSAKPNAAVQVPNPTFNHQSSSPLPEWLTSDLHEFQDSPMMRIEGASAHPVATPLCVHCFGYSVH